MNDDGLDETVLRINARDDDAFDITNLRHFIGPNPYLDIESLVFDLALTGEPSPRPVSALQAVLAQRFAALGEPLLIEDDGENYALLFARTISEAGRLDLGLHLHEWSVTPMEGSFRIAMQTLHKRTQWNLIYTVWDWIEAINHDQEFDFETPFRALQESFGDSVYGGPSTYALLKAAFKRGIPIAYLWDEGVMQYGYGSHQLRGVSTTFDRDSQLDSDFTCRKDDCKSFLREWGFPVPTGDVVTSYEGACEVADQIGYPVVVKPLEGHKGIGVTANIADPTELGFAYDKAAEALREGVAPKLIVERYISGFDFRLLCVDGEFAAAVKREPASVIGDGHLEIEELITRENARPERADSPTSPLGKIIDDDVMANTLAEQGLQRTSVPAPGDQVFLRKVANLSLGGVSENVTDQVHVDTIALCRTIAQHFRLACMGIDVLAGDISRSWKEGNFGIIEINAAPGIFMHLNPALGNPVDVPSKIIESFFSTGADSRIPILTFNRLSKVQLRRILDFVLMLDVTINPGGACEQAVFMRRDELPVHKDYNSNIRNLLRHPRLDLLVAEYPEHVYAREGQYCWGSRLVVLEDPSPVERTLANNLYGDAVVMIREGHRVRIHRGDEVETQTLGMLDEFTSLYLHEVKAICES